MTGQRPISIQLAALGGQGGGVLADWLVEAARHEGYPAMATSIPGVAQRTGATTYYFELLPEKNPPKPPVFSLFPCADDVDLVAALEPMEAGRALGLGFVTRRTTVVTTRQRVYSTAEKVQAGDGRVPVGPVLEGLAASAKRLVALDATALTKSTKSPLNAIVLGTIASTGVLPLGEDAYRHAIRASGVSVEANLRGFEAGLAAADGALPPAQDKPLFDPAPAALAEIVASLPVSAQAMAGHGAARLLDYQDLAYARLYLDRLRAVAGLDHAPARALTVETARRLAAWMAFEDVIRVAQLKTRPGRLARIRAELGVAGEAPFELRDYLKPGREEILGIFPPFVSRLWPAPKPGTPPKGIPLRLRTSGPFGYLALRLLASMRVLRRRSVRYGEETAAIERWLAAVAAAARRDGAFALDVVGLAAWARGYGAVRKRGLAQLDGLLHDFDKKLDADREELRRDVRAALAAIENDPDGGK